MLWKLIFVTVLVAGVSGRFVQNNDQVDTIATAYCTANNAEDKVSEVKASLYTFKACVNGLFDTGTIKREFEEAMRNKAIYDQLFKKQCTKAPQLKGCVRDLLSGIAPCFSASMLRGYATFTVKLIDSVCDNEGAKMALFFKEDGIQCIREQGYTIMGCTETLKANITSVLNVHGGGVEAVLALNDEERCSLDEQAMACVGTAMKSCSNPTPGNLVEELRKKLSCVKANQDAQIEALRQERSAME